MSTTAQPTKLLGLELVRFGCALSVLLFHYNQFYYLPGAPAYVVAEQPLALVLAPFYRLGLYGVQMFWGISGFIFFWKYGEAIAARAVDGAKFFWLRFSRLYPLHLVTLLAVAALQPLYARLAGEAFVYHNDTPSQFLLQLGMATQWGAQADFSFNGPIWSVSAEVFVYALFFLLLKRFGNRVALTLAVLAGALAAEMAGSGAPVINCVRFFFVGGLAAQLHQRFGDDRRLRPAAWLALAAAFAWPMLHGTLGSADAMDALIFVGLPAAMILLADDPAVLSRAAKPIEVAGNLTYSTYLCHFPLQLMLAIAVAAGGWTLPLGSPLFLAAYIGVTMGVGFLVFEGFEKPAQAAIRAWRKQRQPVTA